jgi:prepilin-type N-terminal cleavage/methylation domain-containing protein
MPRSPPRRELAARPPARRRSGFTLLELAVVLAITTVLGALAVPSYSG